jgi:hypothetical protein
MKKISITSIFLLAVLTVHAKTNDFIDLSLKVQKASQKVKTMNLKLEIGDKEFMTKDGSTSVTLKALKLDKDKYKVQIKLKEKSELVTDSELIIGSNGEGVLQNFDSEGNNKLKIVINSKGM